MAVYKNLVAEIAKAGIIKHTIATEIGIDYKSFYNKINGITEFTWSEVQAISEKFFPGMDKDYLFKRSKHEH